MRNSIAAASTTVLLFPCLRSGERRGNSRGTALFSLSIGQTTSTYTSVPLFPSKTYPQRRYIASRVFVIMKEKTPHVYLLYICPVFGGTWGTEWTGRQTSCKTRLFTRSPSVPFLCRFGEQGEQAPERGAR